MSYKIIGLTGLARSGKDSVYKILESRLPRVLRFAFADELKTMCNDLCLKLTGIRTFTDDDKEKECIRPLLVLAGMLARKSDPDFWIKRIRLSVCTEAWGQRRVVITDVRFPNEADWIQKELKGILVHVTRTKNGRPIPPPNGEEAEHDPVLRRRADVQLVAEDLTKLWREVDTKVMPWLK